MIREASFFHKLQYQGWRCLANSHQIHQVLMSVSVLFIKVWVHIVDATPHETWCFRLRVKISSILLKKTSKQCIFMSENLIFVRSLTATVVWWVIPLNTLPKPPCPKRCTFEKLSVASSSLAPVKLMTPVWGNNTNILGTTTLSTYLRRWCWLQKIHHPWSKHIMYSTFWNKRWCKPLLHSHNFYFISNTCMWSMIVLSRMKR